jgi:hypothetical protein
MAERDRQMSWIKAYLFSIAFFVTQVATTALAQTWAVYAPAGAGYSIEMPAEWTVTAAEDPTQWGPVKTSTAEAELPSELFLTMCTIYPAAIMAGQSVTSILDRARDGAVSNAKGKLRSEEMVTVGNLQARQIIVDSPGDLVIVVRFFVNENAMIEALAAGHPGIELGPDTKRFLESMKTVSAR